MFFETSGETGRLCQILAFTLLLSCSTSITIFWNMKRNSSIIDLISVSCFWTCGSCIEPPALVPLASEEEEGFFDGLLFVDVPLFTASAKDLGFFDLLFGFPRCWAGLKRL